MRSLQLNGKSWSVFELGERSLLLEPEMGEVELSHIHITTRMLEAAEIPGVIDIIPAYESIALVYDHELDDPPMESETIISCIDQDSVQLVTPKKIKVPVCYEMGMDWKEVEAHTGLSKNEIIQKHTDGEYTVAMMGFLPGFVYLSGLEKTIACPRKEDPRTNIPAGSVGIGGYQTGIYSLTSPGGWQIIGRTPHSFFDVHSTPPTNIRFGDIITFIRISKEEFEEAIS